MIELLSHLVSLFYIIIRNQQRECKFKLRITCFFPIREQLRVLEDYFRDVPCIVPYAVNRPIATRNFELKK